MLWRAVLKGPPSEAGVLPLWRWCERNLLKTCLCRNSPRHQPVATAVWSRRQPGPPPPLGNMFGGWFFFFPTVFLPGKSIQVVCESPVEVVKSEEVESALQTVDLNEDDHTPEPAEATPKREDRKAPRPSLMAFLRQMVSPCVQDGAAETPRSASGTREPLSQVARYDPRWDSWKRNGIRVMQWEPCFVCFWFNHRGCLCLC